MSNKEILNVAATFCGFFIFANGVTGMVKNRAYSVPQTFISVAALSYMGYKKTRPLHEKLKNRLDDLFSSKTILTKKQLLFWDSKSKTKGVGVNKRIWWTKVEIDEESFNRFIPVNMRNLWAKVYSSSVNENLLHGCSIKKAVLKSLGQVVLENIPDFFQNESIRNYVEQNRLIDVFALRMIYDVYQNVEKCQSDEAVLDYLENSFNEKNSLFYNMGLNYKGKTASYLNRDIYDEGNEKKFKIMEVASCVSILGCSASAVFFPCWEYPLFCTGMMATSSLLYFLNYKHRQDHLNKQLSRFDAKSFHLSQIYLKRPAEVEKNGYVIWYQHSKTLTKLECAKILCQTALNVNETLKSFPKEMSCKEVGELLFLESILRHKTYSLIYKKIIDGATLEKVSSEFGLKPVYQLLLLNRFSNELRQNQSKELRSFLFDFQSCLVQFEENQSLAMRKISKRAFNSLKKIEKLYQQGDISAAERKTFIVRVLETQEEGVFMHVPVGVKLPLMVQKVLKTERIKN